MNYQKESLPAGAKFAATSNSMTDKTIPEAILNKHMAPRGKCGYLIVMSGALQFVWEDTGETLDAAPGHPIIIFPERYHHVKLTGPVEFRIEFYDIPQPLLPDPSASRPGERFCP